MGCRELLCHATGSPEVSSIAGMWMASTAQTRAVRVRNMSHVSLRQAMREPSSLEGSLLSTAVPDGKKRAISN